MTGPVDKPVVGRQQVVHLPFPPEIRDCIYKLVLASDFEGNPDNDPPRGPDTSCLALLLVSKQTYLEAFHIFYRYNNLVFSNGDLLEQFLRNIGYARRQHVTHISPVWKGNRIGFGLRFLKRCPSLTHLDMHIPVIPAWHMELRGFCSCVATLRNVRGLEEVQFFYNDERVDVMDPLATLQYILTTRVARLRFVFLRDAILVNLPGIRRDMIRPRLSRYIPEGDEKIELFKPQKQPKLGSVRKSEVERLQEGSASPLSHSPDETNAEDVSS